MGRHQPVVGVKRYPAGSADKPLIIVVSAKTLKKATDRNLIKRRVREIMRPHLNEKNKDYKVFVNNKEALNFSFDKLRKEIETQL